MDSQPNLKREHFDIIEFIIGVFLKYGILIFTFIFSMIAKIHSMYRYKKRMKPLECTIEMTLCGLGSSLAIYVLHSMNLQLWIFCIMGGFSSLVITPISTVISKEALPILELLVKDLKRLINKWFKKQE